MGHMGQPRTTQNYPAPNGHGAEVEKPGLDGTSGAVAEWPCLTLPEPPSPTESSQSRDLEPWLLSEKVHPRGR